MFARPLLAAASLLLLVTGASASECDMRAAVRGDGNNVEMNCYVIQRDGTAALIDLAAELAAQRRRSYEADRQDDRRYYNPGPRPVGYGYGYGGLAPTYAPAYAPAYPPAYAPAYPPAYAPAYPPAYAPIVQPGPYGRMAPRFSPF